MRKILFLTGTRADFGKLKPLMLAVRACPDFECLIFATGMHVLSRYGLTVNEIYKSGLTNIYTYINQIYGESMEMVLANTIAGLSKYLHEYRPDMIVIHGDRVETLAGAIAGAMQNILVAHIEGGEKSGTIDESVRHSVSKMSHLHFVSNQAASKRLQQLGENPKSIYVIGSPDIDVMLDGDLPGIDEVKARYDIDFADYGILIYHPVTTEPEVQRRNAHELVTALLESLENYVVIYPNNDLGSDIIIKAYQCFIGNRRFRVFSSLRFEWFLTLLKHAGFIMGNSSAGIREAPVYAVPTINIGNRQFNRFHYESIIHVGSDRHAILAAINTAKTIAHTILPSYHFGDGKSTAGFMKALVDPELWNTPKQKQFQDISTECFLSFKKSELPSQRGAV